MGVSERVLAQKRLGWVASKEAGQLDIGFNINRHLAKVLEKSGLIQPWRLYRTRLDASTSS
jgi:hypothetical protein